MKNENTTLAPLITESHRVIAEAIRHFKLKVPVEKILVTIQSKGRKNALGWFWRETWNKGGVHEINLSAEHLKEHNMGETLIHELAHAENCELEIKDCAGRRHNKKFKVMAENLGLLCEEKPAPSVGFGYTVLGPVADKFLTDIKFDRALFEHVRFVGKKTAKPGSRLLKCECPECGYVVRTTQKWLDIGLPTCACGTEMEASI